MPKRFVVVTTKNAMRWFIHVLLSAALMPFFIALLSGCDTSSLLGNSNTSAPTVTTVVPSAGKVGSTFTIQGSGFGTTMGDMGFQNPVDQSKIPAEADVWTDSVIVGKVPFVPGSNVANVTTKIGFSTSDGRVPASLPAFTVTTQ